MQFWAFGWEQNPVKPLQPGRWQSNHLNIPLHEQLNIFHYYAAYSNQYFCYVASQIQTYLLSVFAHVIGTKNHIQFERLSIWLYFVDRNPYTGTLANSDDPDKMPHMVASKSIFRDRKTIFWEIITCVQWASCSVLPAKSDSDVMFCLQIYQGLIIDRSSVY